MVPRPSIAQWMSDCSPWGSWEGAVKWAFTEEKTGKWGDPRAGELYAGLWLAFWLCPFQPLPTQGPESVLFGEVRRQASPLQANLRSALYWATFLEACVCLVMALKWELVDCTLRVSGSGLFLVTSPDWSTVASLEVSICIVCCLLKTMEKNHHQPQNQLSFFWWIDSKPWRAEE